MRIILFLFCVVIDVTEQADMVASPLVCEENDILGPSQCFRNTSLFTSLNLVNTCDISAKTCLQTKQSEEKLASKKMAGEISKQKCAEYTEYANEYDPISKCTKFNFKVLISSGKPTEFDEFPHMVLLVYDDEGQADLERRFCGGSLISERFVLTAGHGVTPHTKCPIYVRLGITKRSHHKYDREISIKVESTIPHPHYKTSFKYHDIALVKLAKQIKMSPRVYPACLHTEKEIPHPTAVATGWGNTNDLRSSDHLLKVELDFIPVTNCNKAYKHIIRKKKYLKHGVMEDILICAGEFKTRYGRNTCQGDSGGPLQLCDSKHDGKCMHKVVGVTVAGLPCSAKYSPPGLYTRVSSYIDWIESIVWSNRSNNM